ncbi:MAG: twin-arginine translocase subunit TatC [Candidatus Thermoplasmatota archaeon]|nr:twin-arginine translocase subunit TatC [Candidatus Thermoplasmatota archaeon]
MEVTPLDTMEEISTHFNEVFSSTKKWLISFLIASIIVSLFIDQIIETWITSFEYEISELTVYSPERWLRMRWGTVMLAGLIISIPYGSYLISKFVNPGLYPFERIIIQYLIGFSTLLICTLVPYSWFVISPNIMKEFTDITAIEQISASYDISMIYTIVLGLTWSLVISLITLTSHGISSILVHRDNINSIPIKWRIHMISLFILYLLLSGPLSPLWLPLSITIIILTELIHVLIPSNNTILIQPGYNTINTDGSTNRVAVLDCNCEDSCPKLINPPSSVAIIKTESICLNDESNERLIQIINSNNYTKLIVTGCNGKPIPKRTRDHLNSSSIKLVGLSWLDQRGYHPDDNNLAQTRRLMQLNNECNIKTNFDDLNVISDPGWGRYIPPGHISLPQYEEI